MRNENGLRMLHVRTTRHHRIPGAHRLTEQRLRDIQDTTRQVTGLLAQVHTNQRRDLVVTGAASSQFATQRGTRTFNQATLQRGMHVLVVDGGHERTR